MAYLISLYYVTSVIMKAETFSRNSDTFLEAVLTFGQVLEDLSDWRTPFVTAFQTRMGGSDSIKGMGLLYIQEALAIAIDSALFNANFFMEYSLDQPSYARCNVLCTSYCTGNIYVENTIIQNYQGVYSSFDYLASTGVDTSQIVGPNPAVGILSS